MASGVLEQQAYGEPREGGIEQLEALVEALLEKQLYRPPGPVEGCMQAEIYRLVDLIYMEVFEEQPRPRSVEEARAKLLKIVNDIKAWSMDELRSRLGI